MTLDELATWIDKHGDFDGAPWMKWFDKNYCDKCEPVEMSQVEYRKIFGCSSYSSTMTCSYCELHHNCKFFPELDYIPDNKDIIRMWLELEVDKEEAVVLDETIDAFEQLEEK
jgi:hypothetical protein